MTFTATPANAITCAVTGETWTEDDRPDMFTCAAAGAWLEDHGLVNDLCGARAGETCEPGCPSHATDPVAQARSEHPGIDDLDEDDDEGCPGHESLAGQHMGEAVFCDGTCQR